MTRETTRLKTLWYMGAKTRLCEEFLDGAVRDLLSPGGTLLDACCGTAAVARWFASGYRILANDSQQFSSVIARAHLEGDGEWTQELDRLEPQQDLGLAISENQRLLDGLVPKALELEDSILSQVIDAVAGPDESPEVLDRYRAFVSEAPLPDGSAADMHISSLHQPLAMQMPELLEQRQQDPNMAPALMCTAYWAHVYFGIRQATRIDSIRHAIDQIPMADPHRCRKQTLYLAALLHAVSVSTSGTSHFAQPRSIARDSELVAVAKRRMIDIDVQFELSLDAIRTEWLESPRLDGNKVYCSDIHGLLEAGSPLDEEDVDLVYLDPPYTADNYSRFYHVLETLVEYDYPQLQTRGGELTRGRYPGQEKRFTSDFCSSIKAEDAFRSVARSCKERGASLLLSYSTDTGLLTRRWRNLGDENPASRFRNLLLEYYGSVEIREKTLMHSGQGDSNRSVRELLLLCEG